MRPSPKSESSSFLASIDWPTLLLYLAMIVAGIFSIYAASYDYDNASILAFDEFSGKQIRWVGLALALGMIILIINWRVYETYAYPIYAGMILLLMVTIVIAPDIKGSHSWLVLGPMSLQPAEFAKCATALALAKLFSEYNFSLNAKASNYVRALAIILVPVFLILLQNETGSALIFLSLFYVLYREGMSGLIMLAALLAIVIFVVAVKYSEPTSLGTPLGRMIILSLIPVMLVIMTFYYGQRQGYMTARNLMLGTIGVGVLLIILSLCKVSWPGTTVLVLAIVAGCGYVTFEALRKDLRRLYVPVAVALGSMLFMFSVDVAFAHLQPHQQKRIMVVLGIAEDPKGVGYNVNQAKIAIGSGGFSGKGFLAGTQTKLKYVPEQHTDFIFCTIGEEEGFIGSSAVVIAFLLLILRVIHIAERQPTTFGRIYAYCVACYFTFHFAINICMVIGLCPVIGIPLPFFSYGGSSLWGFTILLFILLRIDAARKQLYR